MRYKTRGGQEDEARRIALWVCLQNYGNPSDPLHRELMTEIADAGIKTPVGTYSLKAGFTNMGENPILRFNPEWLLSAVESSSPFATPSIFYEDHVL